MSIERKPHPVFLTVWAILVAAMIVFGVIGLRGHWQGVGASLVLAAMAVWEIVALIYKSPEKLRDTLSEITTYINRVLSKHRIPFVGWNTLVAIQALALGWLIFVVGVFWGGWIAAPYVAVVGALFGKGQHAHWLDPASNG